MSDLLLSLAPVGPLGCLHSGLIGPGMLHKLRSRFTASNFAFIPLFLFFPVTYLASTVNKGPLLFGQWSVINGDVLCHSVA